MSLLCCKCCVSCLLYSSFLFSFFSSSLFLVIPALIFTVFPGFHKAPAANSFVRQAFNIFAWLFIFPLRFHAGLWIRSTEDVLPRLLLVIRRCPLSPCDPREMHQGCSVNKQERPGCWQRLRCLCFAFI